MAELLPMGNAELLLELLRYPMPFGKYKGQRLRDLPMAYLEWFAHKGFPPGKLGTLLQTLYEIRLNGLDHLLTELERQQRGTYGVGSAVTVLCYLLIYAVTEIVFWSPFVS